MYTNSPQICVSVLKQKNYVKNFMQFPKGIFAQVTQIWTEEALAQEVLLGPIGHLSIF